MLSASQICPCKVRGKNGVENVIFHHTLLISQISYIRILKLRVGIKTPIFAIKNSIFLHTYVAVATVNNIPEFFYFLNYY